MQLSNTYEFFCPVKICSGNKALEHLPFELELLGAKKPLVVANKEVTDRRQIKHVRQAFKDSKITPGICDAVPAQADLNVIQQVAGIYREKHCDAIIAVGGGAVCDLAKVVNLVVSEETDDVRHFTEAGSIKDPLKPFAAVLTSAGNGFETTKLATFAGLVFSSPFLLPNVVVIDPRMTVIEDIHTTIATALTALTFAVEAYTCRAKNPVTAMYAYPAIQFIRANLLKVINNPADRNGCVALVNAVAMAGCAFSTAPLRMIHKLGEVVSAACHLPLGRCLGMLLPYVLEYHTHKHGYNPAELLLPLTNFDVYASTPEDQKAQQAIEVIRRFLTEISVAAEAEAPLTLQAAKIPKDKLNDLAQAASGESAAEFDADDGLIILEHAWEGKPMKSLPQ